MFERRGRQASDLCGTRRLGIKNVICENPQPDVVAGIGKIDYLTSTIAQQLRKCDYTLLDAKDVRPRVTFTEDVLLGFNPADGAAVEAIMLGLAEHCSSDRVFTLNVLDNELAKHIRSPKVFPAPVRRWDRIKAVERRPRM
jgi:hypothetical protein